MAEEVQVLEGLISGVTTLFVLSLAVERVEAVFKKRDWQPLSVLRHWDKESVRVDLSSGKALRGQGQGRQEPMASGELKGRLRAANAENTLLIGMALALLAGANAFGSLPGFQMQGDWQVVAKYAQICLTGAAAAVGSSFWYDILGLLAEVRRARASLAAGAPQAGAAPGIPAAALLAGAGPQGAPFPVAARLQAAADFEALRKAAQQRVPELEKHYGQDRVRLVEQPRGEHGACLVFEVDPKEGVPVHAQRESLLIPPAATSYSVPVIRKG